MAPSKSIRSHLKLFCAAVFLVQASGAPIYQAHNGNDLVVAANSTQTAPIHHSMLCGSGEAAWVCNSSRETDLPPADGQTREFLPMAPGPVIVSVPKGSPFPGEEIPEGHTYTSGTTHTVARKIPEGHPHPSGTVDTKHPAGTLPPAGARRHGPHFLENEIPEGHPYPSGTIRTVAKRTASTLAPAETGGEDGLPAEIMRIMSRYGDELPNQRQQRTHVARPKAQATEAVPTHKPAGSVKVAASSSTSSGNVPYHARFRTQPTIVSMPTTLVMPHHTMAPSSTSTVFSLISFKTETKPGPTNLSSTSTSASISSPTPSATPSSTLGPLVPRSPKNDKKDTKDKKKDVKKDKKKDAKKAKEDKKKHEPAEPNAHHRLEDLRKLTASLPWPSNGNLVSPSDETTWPSLRRHISVEAYPCNMSPKSDPLPSDDCAMELVWPLELHRMPLVETRCYMQDGERHVRTERLVDLLAMKCWHDHVDSPQEGGWLEE